MNKIYIETMGCPKNQEDSERAGGMLTDDDFIIVQNPEDADFIIINTCGFIDDAKRESINRILELAEYKENDSDKALVVTGCLSQRYKEELFEELTEVDIMIGVNDYVDLPQILKSYAENAKNVANERVLHVEGRPGLLEGKRVNLHNTHYSYLKIAEGCSNACTYCAIPRIRGAFRSVPMADVVAEATYLAASGTKELILIAQDVSAYGYDIYSEYRLHELLEKLNAIEGIRWIRLMYCYEERITDELIHAMATLDKVVPYIDIPLQHVSDHVLNGMNRRSTHQSISKTIHKLRAAMPDIAIRTTFITGFPGETEEDFDILYDFINEVRFERLGVFSYSKEEGTPAASMHHQVDIEVADQRKDSIMLAQIEISREHNEDFVGRELEVIVDEIEEGAYVGRTKYDAPEIDEAIVFTSSAKLAVGDILMVCVTDAMDYDLVGVNVTDMIDA
ncbi:MAG: 30S ribosomal protein S12 methylthiotransferase RimO [Clostridiales Family XIII bacterium]|jgi:ribosomal protein S12 methylthiotransferase|nr:30S ribosomal protein S12 methylthiotransferase RimO [Clostridiales Family XIII bacterium]